MEKSLKRFKNMTLTSELHAQYPFAGQNTDTGNQKGMSPCCVKQLAVSLVFSLKFIYLNMKGPNKHIKH